MAKYLYPTPESIPQPLRCLSCDARLQENVDGDMVHARAGTLGCPPIPVPEIHPLALVRLAGLVEVN